MPDPVTGLIIGGASIVGGVGSAAIQSGAAKRAGQQQMDATQLSVEEQRAAREEMRRLLEPYAKAGEPALQALMGAAGLSGPESQQAFISEQAESPLFQGLARQGEDAILQNASATGGFRGGNVQGALGQFRPALLNQFVQQQYDRLAGITSLGQNAAAGTGTAGIQTGANIGNLLSAGGAAQANATLAGGQAWGNALSGLTNNIGQAAGFAAMGGFGPRVPAGGTFVQPYAAPGLNVPGTMIPAFGPVKF